MMIDKNLTHERMIQALTALDHIVSTSFTLIVGGGGAMILAHQFPLSTMDVDAYPKGMELSELDVYVKQIADELSLPKDWLNPYFSTFAHTLPSDYGDRLINVYEGKKIKALALGKEDLLVMKCFAGRQKDVPHVRALLKKKTDVEFVGKHIRSLIKKRIPGAEKALEFLHEIEDWQGNQS